MVKKKEDSENFYSKYLRISLPFLVLIFLSFSVFALTTNDANYSGGIYNGTFEIGDGNRTASGFLPDTNNNLTFVRNAEIAMSIFDNSIFYNGNKSIRLETNSTGRGYISNSTIITSSTFPTNMKYMTKVKPNTNYKLSAWVKTNNAVDAKLNLLFYNDNSGVSADKFSSSLVGSNDWTYLSQYYLSPANANFVRWFLTNNVAGNDSNVWFDDVRLEEVGSVNLSGQLQGRPSIVVTGVSDNAIDQADTNNSSTGTFGNLNSQAMGQCFTPTQNKITGIIFQKSGGTGTFTGDVIVSLRDANGSNNVPGNTILAQVTIPNATWEAYPVSTDWLIPLPATVDANGTKQYCWDLNSTTRDGDNYARIRTDTAIGYSGGSQVDWNGGTGLWRTTNKDLYFKVLFEKQSSAFDLNVCSQGDSVCESKTYDIDFLENGENYLINPADAPLFYLGDNNVYFMMHSDSDYNNTTPSMMAKLTYTFDKPTTTLSRAKGTVDNTEIITLTCTNGTTGNCNQTYYSFNGTTYYTYNTPFVLNNGTYNIRYYSTADNNNTETINTSSFTVPIQGSTATCSIAGLFPLLLIAFGITALGGLFFTKQFLDTGDMKYMINFILMLIIGVLIIITIAPILC
jgi:hypothetical protein